MMPTITLDENSLRILKNTKGIMKNKGESAAYSDAIRHLSKFSVNLCRTCVNDFAECHSDPKFGNGIGNDNVYDCPGYVLRPGKERW